MRRDSGCATVTVVRTSIRSRSTINGHWDLLFMKPFNVVVTVGHDLAIMSSQSAVGTCDRHAFGDAMKLEEWNDLLFRNLVVENGQYGDPLYLYVDGDVLADIAGIAEPDDAVNDFQDAFMSYNFYRAKMAAERWQRENYKGIPEFFAALAMSVLAVTLESLGKNSNNVAARQYQLLGGSVQYDNFPNAPAHYDCVPAIWEVWNEFLLSSEGCEYGIPTACGTRQYPRQGYARSQSFIRHRDRQDIYSFLGTVKHTLPEPGDPNEPRVLVEELREWLNLQGSPTRLAHSCSQAGLEDELGTALSAIRKFWTGEQTKLSSRSKGAKSRIAASLHWDPRDEVLSLVAPLKGVGGVVGSTVTDFTGEAFTVDGSWPYVFLTGTDSDPTTWIRDELQGYELSDGIRVDWAAQPITLFESDRGGSFWIEAGNPNDDQRYLLLLGPGAPLLSDIQLSADGTDGAGETHVELESFEGPTDGFAWLMCNGEPEIRGEIVRRLLGASPQSTRRRRHRLTGGLPLDRARRRFLNGFEPDIEVSANWREERVIVTIDGQMLHLPPEVDGSRCNGMTCPGIFRLSRAQLEPGEHALSVEVGDTIERSTFVSSLPVTPAIPNPLPNTGPDERIVRFSLTRSLEPTILLLQQDGTALSLAMHADTPSWFAALADNGESCPEPYFDSSWFDTVAPLPGENGREFVVAASAICDSDGDRPVFFFTREVEISALTSARAVKSVEKAKPSAIMHLMASTAEKVFLDKQAHLLLREFKHLFSSQFGAGSGRRKVEGLARLQLSRPTQLAVQGVTQSDELGAAENPYDQFLWWLTERGPEGASRQVAEQSFKWLQDNADASHHDAFRSVVHNLTSLGHIRGGTVLSVDTPLATWLPDSDAHVAISGARTRETLAVLASGEGEVNPITEAALQRVSATMLAQGQLDANPSNALTATSVFLQLGSRSQSPEDQAHDLGFDFFNPSLEHLHDVPSLSERLTDPARRLAATPKRLDLFTPRKEVPGGAWRQVHGLRNQESSAFLRSAGNLGNRYLWWDNDESVLTDCGWILGLWGFHLETANNELFGVTTAGEFAIRSHMWLPSDIERFLVARSSLLPQKMRSADGREWSVYINVPPPIAAAVSDKLGHHWGRSSKARPSVLENLEPA